MTEATLFPLPEPIAPPVDELAGLSAGQRLTIRNRQQIERGVHPATLLPLVEGKTCGGCAHLVRTTNGNGTWLKCERHRLGMSRSAASDVRSSWPACTLWALS